MPKIPLYNQEGATVGEIDLMDEVFAVDFHPGLIHQVVVAQRSNLRQGTSMQKTRSNVRGGGKKPWRQKGTGRARQGSIRAPHWVGGGKVFGGQTDNYHKDLPIKMKKGSLRSILSSKLSDGALKVVDTIQFSETKTKLFAKVMAKFEYGKGTIVVHDGAPENVLLSARNIPGLRMVRAQDLSTLDSFEARNILITKNSVEMITERLLG